VFLFIPQPQNLFKITENNQISCIIRKDLTKSGVNWIIHPALLGLNWFNTNYLINIKKDRNIIPFWKNLLTRILMFNAADEVYPLRSSKSQKKPAIPHDLSGQEEI
jgi:hypothetical protein